MSESTGDAGSNVTLRQRAQQQLVAGIAPASRSGGVSVEALALLHRLASSPASASDALSLLHELQVHQVELDLQQAQLEATEQELTDDLAHYRALFERAPIAHVVLDASGRIVNCNRAGAERFGSSISEVCGRRFNEYLSADSRLALAALLRDARTEASNPRRTVRPRSGPGGSPGWQITASTVPGSDVVQLMIFDAAASAQD